MSQVCHISPLVVLFCIRVAGFSVALSLLPTRLVPISVYFAIISALVVFFLPILSPESCLGGAALISFGLLEVPVWSVVITELGIGMFAAVAVSGVGYSAYLIGAWISRLVLPASVDLEFSREWDFETSRNCKSLFYGFLLFFLVVVFALEPSSNGFSVLFELVGETLFAFPYSSEGISYSSGNFGSLALLNIIFEVVATVVNQSFYFAFLMAIPILFTSLLVDLFFFILNRYLSYVAHTSTVISVKIPILVLLLSLCIVPYSDELIVGFDLSVDTVHVRKIFTNVSAALGR